MNEKNTLSISQQTLINAINFFEKTHGQKLMIKIRFETNPEKELPLIEWVKLITTELNSKKPYFEYIRIYAEKRILLSGDFKGINDNTEFSFGNSILKEDDRKFLSSKNYLFGFILIQFLEQIPKFQYEENTEELEKKLILIKELLKEELTNLPQGEVSITFDNNVYSTKDFIKNFKIPNSCLITDTKQLIIKLDHDTILDCVVQLDRLEAETKVGIFFNREDTCSLLSEIEAEIYFFEKVLFLLEKREIKIKNPKKTNKKYSYVIWFLFILFIIYFFYTVIPDLKILFKK